MIRVINAKLAPVWSAARIGRRVHRIGSHRTDMGIHGWIALTLAVFGVAGLHIGLMWLARKPHDGEFKPDPQGDADSGAGRADQADRR